MFYWVGIVNANHLTICENTHNHFLTLRLRFREPKMDLIIINKKVGFRLLTILPILLSVSLLSSCGEAEALGEDIKEELVISVPVEVAPLSIGHISSNYETTAVLEAKEEAFVVPRASGIIG